MEGRVAGGVSFGVLHENQVGPCQRDRAVGSGERDLNTLDGARFQHLKESALLPHSREWVSIEALPCTRPNDEVCRRWERKMAENGERRAT